MGFLLGAGRLLPPVLGRIKLVVAGVGRLPGVAANGWEARDIPPGLLGVEATGCETRDIAPRKSIEDAGVVGPTVVVGGVNCLGVPLK